MFIEHSQPPDALPLDTGEAAEPADRRTHATFFRGHTGQFSHVMEPPVPEDNGTTAGSMIRSAHCSRLTQFLGPREAESEGKAVVYISHVGKDHR